MAITHVNTTTASDPNTGSVTISKPATTGAKDILLVFGVGTQGAWGLPTGFNQIAVTTDGSFTSNMRAYAWYKVCDGSEGSTFTFTNTTAGGNGSPLALTMSCFRGVDNSDPIMNQSVTQDNGSTEPANPSTSFTQSDDGRLVFARVARRTSSSGVSQIPTFSTATSGWSELGDVGNFSGGTVNYGVGTYAQNSDTGSGARTEPAVTCSQTEAANGYFLLALRAEKSGAFASNLSKVSASWAVNVHDDAAFASTLGHVTANWAATHYVPATGALASTLGHVSASFNVTSTGGAFSSQLKHVVANFAGGIVHGTFASTLGHVSASWAGDVNPIGAFSSQLSKVVASFVAETQPFGAQVIFIEPEKRGLRITQDETTPILLSEVTQE